MTIKFTILAATLLAAGLAQAGGTQYDLARVVQVDPQRETVRTPVDREVCWDEDHYERASSGSRSHTPTVVGAVIGGLVGSRFGSGSGKRAATVAGAALGGSIGHDAGRQARASDDYYRVSRERCTIQRDYRQDSVVSGYRVAYEYNGRIYHTHMREHPGEHVRVRIDVSPAH